MSAELNRELFLVKEHVGMFKAANNFDIYDPHTGELILLCREDNLGFWTRLLRFTDYKRFTPFQVEIRSPAGDLVVEVRRGVSLFLSKVEVFDGSGVFLGSFAQKFFSIGGKFEVLDPREQLLCTLQGKWTGWNFQFLAGEQELAHVAKKWSGIGKEMFTSADNYVLQISPGVPPDGALRKLILAAVMCIDMVLKE